jgi:hypothetical protein
MTNDKCGWSKNKQCPNPVAHKDRTGAWLCEEHYAYAGDLDRLDYLAACKRGISVQELYAVRRAGKASLGLEALYRVAHMVASVTEKLNRVTEELNRSTAELVQSLEQDTKKPR